eukprot:SAG31_NODE_4747_length_2984_cov_3.461698_1_plen_305_part_00
MGSATAAAYAADSSVFKIVFLGSSAPDGTPRPVGATIAKLMATYGDKVVAIVTETDAAAKRELADADAAYGFCTAELLAAAPKLKWIQCPMAAPPESYFIPELTQRDEIQVTNMRGIYDEELSIHILTLMLAVNRQLGNYRDQQRQHEYTPLTFNRGVYTPDAKQDDYRQDVPSSTALLVGVGAAGLATGKLLKALGMAVIGCDARRKEPHPCLDELHPAEALDTLLPRADFVLLTIPHTPATEGMFDAERFEKMKHTAVFVNVGRGATTSLQDLDAALRSGTIAGAALDVFEVEPLPKDHPIW